VIRDMRKGSQGRLALPRHAQIFEGGRLNLSTRLIPVGFGNYLSIDRIVAIAVPSSAPIKRSIQGARPKKLVIDLTNGHRIKSVVFTDCKYIVLVALWPVTIDSRLTDSV